MLPDIDENIDGIVVCPLDKLKDVNFGVFGALFLLPFGLPLGLGVAETGAGVKSLPVALPAPPHIPEPIIKLAKPVAIEVPENCANLNKSLSTSISILPKSSKFPFKLRSASIEDNVFISGSKIGFFIFSKAIDLMVLEALIIELGL